MRFDNGLGGGVEDHEVQAAVVVVRVFRQDHRPAVNRDFGKVSSFMPSRSRLNHNYLRFQGNLLNSLKVGLLHGQQLRQTILAQAIQIQLLNLIELKTKGKNMPATFIRITEH